MIPREDTGSGTVTMQTLRAMWVRARSVKKTSISAEKNVLRPKESAIEARVEAGGELRRWGYDVESRCVQCDGHVCGVRVRAEQKRQHLCG